MSNYQPDKVAQMYDSLQDQGETAILQDQYHFNTVRLRGDRG